MAQDIHAHNLLNLLVETPMSHSELAATIASEYGSEARFCTCKQQGLALDDLLEFLLARQKVVIENEKLTVNTSRVCNH
ncbi:hypothetical protein BCU68_10105 [Vibrio sp. 10N.286.49.B3]|uniref:YecH family metal-binding protein n=1 Tax=Vibrio sp. 10N.286.49.B3 TaxID=1880855 RepID=UPI000C82F6D6|nr:YecH family metal-binding protein [Vibrio sp. 10N.286.49.B3]PMH45438.1 hypothetical protein BCU68_10105 [Vibrio sp. 10N.286.49.B3]